MRRLRNLTLFTLFLLMLVFAGGWVKLMHMQAMAFAHPARTVPEMTPNQAGIAHWEAVTFEAADGISLKGWYIPPDENGAALVFVHGLAGNRGDYLPEAARLSQLGYGALLFDLRNHGDSGGDATSMGAHEVRDVQAAFVFLAAQPDVNSDCIGIFGGSMGGATAIRAMTQIPDARVLVIDSAYTSVVDVISDGIQNQVGIPGFPSAQIILWMTGREVDADLFSVRPIDDIGELGRPILLMHGEADPTIPVSHARELFVAAQEPKILHIVPSGGHGHMMQSAEGVVIDFLDEHLCN